MLICDDLLTAGQTAKRDVEKGQSFSVVTCAQCLSHARAVRQNDGIIVTFSSTTECAGRSLRKPFTSNERPAAFVDAAH